jgi:isoquinoline 1-oxidoreductase subunit beta
MFKKVVFLAKNRPLSAEYQVLSATESNATGKVFSAQGVACGAYKGMSYAAAVAQVELVITAEKRIQSIRVDKLWCTHDCGRMIDSQGVLAQVQGNLVWTLGMVLTEQLDAPRGTPEALNFSSYRIPRIIDIPPMEIELIESSAAPSGAGETAMVAGAGAIANAVVRAMREAGLPVPKSMPIKISG